ncbi:MAG: 2-phosphosulfolactate phosphatase [Ignavibacteriales bacterium]|nr:2-phosphosulfolactate phosphatase [Ignavibacteriales bacterium]
MKTNPVSKKISVTVHLTPNDLDEMELKDKNLVVIDVLRASTTIAMALQNGAKEIMPVGSIENAVKISGSLFGGVTLRAGERNSKMIEGFNLGNSPKEFTEDVVKGKSIIFFTTNGTVAIGKGKHAKNLVIAGFVNLSLVVDFLSTLNEDIVILCAAKENTFCVEDAVCAGRIINKMSSLQSIDLLLDDAGIACAMLDKGFGKSILKMLKSSEHGKYLTEIGFVDDLKICAGLDTVPVLPVLTGNVIKLQKEKL